MKIFFSPDNFSPFAKGGLNSYVYCTNDPVNNRDPSGHYALTSLSDDAIYNFFNGRLRKALAADRKITTEILARNLHSEQILVDRLNKVANSEYLLRHRRNDNTKLLAQTNPAALKWSNIQEYSNNKMLVNHIEKQSPLQSKVLIATNIALRLDEASRLPPSIGHDFLSSVIGPAYGGSTGPNLPALYGARNAILNQMREAAVSTQNFSRVRALDEVLAKDIARIRNTF
jgi:hypothetical protein